MKQQIYKKRKSLNFLAKTKLGKYINKMICSHLLYAHFNAVDEYLSESLIHPDEVLEKALQKSIEAGLPVMNISANEGKLLQLLAASVKAQRILEIGTLGGYSTIWLARGMQKGGKIITLEYNPVYAKIAKENIKEAGFSDCVEFRVGLAIDSLKHMEQEKIKSFDLIFIDADKNNYPLYLEYALRFSHSGTMIIGDNVVHEEEVLDKNNKNPDAQGIRNFIELLGSDPRINATAIQTVGSKWHDGFSLALVK